MEPENDLEKQAVEGITTDLIHDSVMECDKGGSHDWEWTGQEEQRCKKCRERKQDRTESEVVAHMWRDLAIQIVRSLNEKNRKKFIAMSPTRKVNVLGALSESPAVQWSIGGKSVGEV